METLLISLIFSWLPLVAVVYVAVGFLTALFVLFVMRESPVTALLAFSFWPIFWLAGLGAVI